MKKRKLLKRIKKLESIVSSNSITLTKMGDENTKVIIHLGVDNLLITKFETTTDTETTTLSDINLNQ